MPVVIIDGRPVTLTDEEAAKVAPLKGNALETTSQAIGRAEATAEKDYYESGGQQTIAGLEGLASGATIGLSDLLLDDEETRARARYNPGTRLATELTGAIVPALLSGGTGAAASVAKLTPTALAAGAGTRVAGALGRGLPTALAVEGAVQGAGQSVSRAVLANDPVTIEAVVSGAGMGALLGAGVGVMARGVSRAGVAAENRIAAKQAEAAEALLLKKSPAMERAAGSIDEMAKAAKRSVKEIEGAMKPASLQARYKQLSEAGSAINSDAMAAALVRGPANEAKTAAAKALRMAQADMTAAKRALEAGDAVTAAGHMDDFTKALNDAGAVLGSAVKVPAKAAQATANLVDLSVLEKMPQSPAKWLSMPDDKAANYLESLKRAVKPAGDELDTLRATALRDIEEGLKDAGLAPAGGTPDEIVDALGTYRDSLRKATTKAGKGEGPASKTHSFLDFVKRSAHMVGARGASHAARSAGGGILGGALAYQAGGGMLGFLASELLGLRAAATAHVDQLISGLAPKAAKGLRRVAPVSEILRRPITSGLSGNDKEAGRPNSKKVTNRDAAKERAMEITQMAPAINDIAYSVSEPIMAESPETAIAVAQQLTKGFQHLLAATPRDPGGTHVGLQSDWQPSDTQALTFASVMEAVCYPMESLDRMLQGDGDPAAAEALWACYPALMQEAAVGLVERLPEIQEKTDFATRASLSTTFRVPLDGLLTQQSIAALQAQFIPSIYRDGGSPGGAPAKPKSGSGPVGGRPPAVGTSNTSSTKTQSLQR